MTIVVVVVKLKFLHYNLLFPVVLITIIAITLKKYVLSKDYRFFYVGLLMLNFLCLVAPDKMVYKLRNSHRYFWSEEPLDLSHFNIIRKVENDTAATVNPMVIGSISRVYNYPPAVLFTSDNKELSWFDTFRFTSSKEDKKLLEQLLEHEKRHLDIAEIYMRKTYDSLEHIVFSTYSEKYGVIKYFFKLSDSVQKVFDYETDNGTNEESIKKWNVYIERSLNE